MNIHDFKIYEEYKQFMENKKTKYILIEVKSPGCKICAVCSPKVMNYLKEKKLTEKINWLRVNVGKLDKTFNYISDNSITKYPTYILKEFKNNNYIEIDRLSGCNENNLKQLFDILSDLNIDYDNI